MDYFLKKPNFKQLLRIELFVVLTTFILRIYDLFSPYGKGILFSGSTNFWHITGENLLKYGYLNSLFTPLLNTGNNLEPIIYINHPSLLSFYLSIFYKIFGSSEITTKLAGLLGWYLVSYVIFLLAKKQSIIFAHYTLIASLLIPFTNCFSNCVDSIGGPLVTLFSVLLIYQLEIQSPSLIIFATVILGTFSEWTFIPLLFTCIFINKYKKQRATLIFATCFSAVALTTSYIVNFYKMIFGFNSLMVNSVETLTNWLIKQKGYLELISKIKFKLEGRVHNYDDNLNLLKWIIRVGYKYIFNLFTPLFYPSICLLIYKTGLRYLPLIIQSSVVIFVFANGCYRHSFWTAPLVPLASLALGFFIYKFRKWTNVFVLSGLIFTVAYTVHFKKKNSSNFYEKAGKMIQQNSNEGEIVLIRPKAKHNSRGSKLLLGWYSKRDIIFIKEERQRTEDSKSIKLKSQNTKFKEIDIY